MSEFKRISSIESALLDAEKKVTEHENQKRLNLIKILIELLDKMQTHDITLNDIQIIINAYAAGYTEDDIIKEIMNV